jgi:NitT/TauT family transport system substrate-binding protein
MRLNTAFARVLMAAGILFAITAAACQPVSEPPAASQPVTLKIAILPILDSVPMLVAKQEGLFEANGIVVEFIPIGSGPERDQLIAAGQADGMVNELLSTMFFNKEQVQVQAVRFARAATSQVHLFSILASGQSGITTIDGLKGVEVGVSQGTVIDYLTTRLLQEEGFSQEEIRTTTVPRLDLRMSLLQTGELKAAMLPEPMTSLAIQQGARVIIDDSSHPEYSYSTLTFRKEVIDRNPQALRGFLKAVEEATLLINENPSRFNDILVEQKLVPAPLAGQFEMPVFVTAGVPSEAQWNDTLDWAKQAGLLTSDLSYADSVRSDLLP